jgi:hypothetical protein
MHDDYREREAALEITEVGEQRRDLGAQILVDAMQTDKGIEDEECGAQRGDGVGKACLVVDSKARVASNVNFAELAEAYEMTGGYIRNAALRAAFFAASAGSDIKTSHLRRAANLEMASMGKVVGRAHG